MSHYDNIKEAYLKRRQYEHDSVAAANVFVRKLGNGLGWPEAQRRLVPVAQAGADEHVVEGNFAFNKHGRLRAAVEFTIDADSKPATIEFHVERKSPNSWLIIVGGVKHTFDLYGMRLLPDPITHAVQETIKTHFEPDYPLGT